jgi:hypothetical protein
MRARVGAALHWTRLNVEDNSLDQNFTPVQFGSFRPVGRVQSADVTWRLVPECALDGYFMSGDAAAGLLSVVKTEPAIRTSDASVFSYDAPEAFKIVDIAMEP